MTARQFWMGVIVLVVAILAHAVIGAAYPRHEFRTWGDNLIRCDRWTGRCLVVRPDFPR